MKKIFVLLRLAIILTCIQYFNPLDAKAALTIVDADQDVMDILLDMKYFQQEKPFFLFAQQRCNVTENKGVDLLTKTTDRANFIFKDSGPKDLAVTLAYLDEFWFYNYEGVSDFFVPEDQTAEIFCVCEGVIYAFQLRIDGKTVASINLDNESMNNKYFKIWSDFLYAGRHSMEIVLSDLDVPKGGVLKLVVTDQKKRVMAEKIISERMQEAKNETGYIFERNAQNFYIP